MKTSRAKPVLTVELPFVCLTIDQVAAANQVSRTKVVEWTHRAGFPVIREEGTIRIPVRALLDWLDKTAFDTNARPAERTPIAALSRLSGSR